MPTITWSIRMTGVYTTKVSEQYVNNQQDGIQPFLVEAEDPNDNTTDLQSYLNTLEDGDSKMGIHRCRSARRTNS